MKFNKEEKECLVAVIGTMLLAAAVLGLALSQLV
jgi:hypothetical protein